MLSVPPTSIVSALPAVASLAGGIFGADAASSAGEPSFSAMLIQSGSDIARSLDEPEPASLSGSLPNTEP